LILTAVLFMLGVVVAESLEKEWGKDPRCIVIDEYACILLPLYFTPIKLVPLGITFLLFRVFDIVKPPPVRNMENLRGGWGIMLDDLLAAIYTIVIILIMRSLGIFY
jgi:phosphatidylglycerophosphatase A